MENAQLDVSKLLLPRRMFIYRRHLRLVLIVIANYSSHHGLRLPSNAMRNTFSRLMGRQPAGIVCCRVRDQSEVSGCEKMRLLMLDAHFYEKRKQKQQTYPRMLISKTTLGGGAWRRK